MNYRNKPCPCGSGKKHKKCCLTKQQRTTQITINLKKPKPVNSWRINPITNEFEIFSFSQKLSPKSITIEHGYEKKHKNQFKVTSKAFSEKAFLSLPVRYLEQYDLLYAIDTNYKTLNSIKTCATGVVEAKKSLIFTPNITAINMKLKYCFNFSTTHTKPENFAWSEAIKQIPFWTNISNRKIGIIVDSDLGNLQKINERQEPVFEKTFLPTNFSLLYASSDHDMENPMNKMIELADFGARNLLDKVIEIENKYKLIVCMDAVKIWSIQQKNSNSISFLG